MKRLIKKILKEDRRQMYLNKIIHVMKNDYPLLYNLKDYGFYEQLSEEELNYVLSDIFGEPVEYYEGGNIYNENGNKIYYEDYEGDWYRKEYDENGNKIYFEDSDGYWSKKEYDENGNEIYFEDSDGDWYRKEYDENVNQIYFESSDGTWVKYEYNENGDLIYHETYEGVIRDNR